MSEANREALLSSLRELDRFFLRLEGLAREGRGIVRAARRNFRRLDHSTEMRGFAGERARRRSLSSPPFSTSSPPASAPASGSEDGASGFGRRRRDARGRCPRLPSYTSHSSASSSLSGSPVRPSPSPPRVDVGPTSTIHNDTTLLPSPGGDSLLLPAVAHHSCRL